MDEADGPTGDDNPKTATSSREGSTSAAHDADATIDAPGSPVTPAGISSPDERAAPETRSIGPYRLVQKLGEGGMGQVWLAEQTAPLRRLVAPKRIRAGVSDNLLLERFESERQALARMNHPAIAKVFDAGTTSDGQPYFVMEHVPGIPITLYCDHKRLSVRERIELSTKVCEGVQHASRLKRPRPHSLRQPTGLSDFLSLARRRM
jgi:serine/threonine protein kinase